MAEVVSFGEVLMDMMPVDESSGDVYRAIPGGAPANFLAQVRRLGHDVAFLSTVGCDHFGEVIVEALAQNGIDTTHVHVTDEAPTTLAFVHHDAEGDRSFSFYRNPGADLLTMLDAQDKALIREARFFHVGTLSMVQDPARQAMRDALECAKANGVGVSFDPNFRANLWKEPRDMIAAAKYVLPYVTVAKISREELEAICGSDDVERNVEALFERTPLQLVTVTDGKRDVLAMTRQARAFVPAFSVRAVDTTGCGDAFGGTVLACVLDGKPLEQWDEADLTEALRRGNAAGALTAMRRGAMPALPRREEIEAFLAGV